MMNKPDAAVVVRGLRVRRGAHTVFDGLDVEIRRGSVTGLLGPSGCGKSTLMRAIVGVQKTRGGTVTVLGERAGSRGLRRRVSYSTQSAAVYDDLSVRDNLRYFARVAGLGRREADRAIGVVGLTDHVRSLAGDLSGGQRSRVSLAVALLGDPELIVLDEPTVGLDPLLRDELWSTFRSIADAGATLLVSSHVMDEAARCDRILLMRDGRVIADTTPAGLLAETGAPDADAAFLALIRADRLPDAAGSHAAERPEAGRRRAAQASDGARSGADHPVPFAPEPRPADHPAADADPVDHPLTRRERRAER